MSEELRAKREGGVRDVADRNFVDVYGRRQRLQK